MKRVYQILYTYTQAECDPDNPLYYPTHTHPINPAWKNKPKKKRSNSSLYYLFIASGAHQHTQTNKTTFKGIPYNSATTATLNAQFK